MQVSQRSWNRMLNPACLRTRRHAESPRLDRATRVNALGGGVLLLDSRGLARPLLFWCVLRLACAESGLSAPMQRADLIRAHCQQSGFLLFRAEYYSNWQNRVSQ